MSVFQKSASMSVYGRHNNVVPLGASVARSRITNRTSKYSDVSSVVQSGRSTRNLKMKTPKQMMRRKNEMFSRIKPRQLALILREYRDDETAKRNAIPKGPPKIVTYEADAKPTYDKQFLILDLRDEDDFGKSHITHAVNLPMRVIRAGKTIPQLFQFRSRTDGIIVLYDEREYLAGEAANMLVEKNFPNVFVLTGGLEHMDKLQPIWVIGADNLIDAASLAKMSR